MRKDINSVATDVKHLSTQHREDRVASSTQQREDRAALVALWDKNDKRHRRDAAAHATLHSKDAELHRKDMAALTAQLVAFEAQRRDDAMRLEAQRREDAAALAAAHREEMREMRHAIKDLETGLKSEELGRARAEQARTSVPENSTTATGRK